MPKLTFTRDWTWRTPMVTIEYRAGVKADVEPEIAAAARAAGAVKPVRSRRVKPAA